MYLFKTKQSISFENKHVSVTLSCLSSFWAVLTTTLKNEANQIWRGSHKMDFCLYTQQENDDVKMYEWPLTAWELMGQSTQSLKPY